MKRSDAHDEDLDRLAQRLRSERPRLDPLRLDQLKTAALARTRRDGGSGMRRRLAVAGLTVGLMAATTGGVIAAGGASQSGGNAATAQYGHGVKGFKHHKHPKHPTHVFHIQLQIPKNVKLNNVTVTLNGKTVLVLTGRQATANFAVTLPCGKGTVKIVAVTSAGQTSTETRVLQGCSISSRRRHGR